MKILDNGIAIVETDTHIGKWIQEMGRIDHDATVREFILPLFKPDWHVIDVGADVGSHTVAYATAAARVLAFEPNREQFVCLVWNCRNLQNVTCLPLALGACAELGALVRCANAGAGYMSADRAGSIMCIRLDSLPLERLDFLKIDVEGWEPNVLAGASQSIRRFKPLILLEMNIGCLERYGFTYERVFEELALLNYTWHPFPEDCDLMNTPQYDLLATPK